MNIKQYKNAVAELGCLICERPAELHHPRLSCGMGQRESDWLVIPLCEDHHRLNGFGHAVHNGQGTFEQNYMNEAKMIAMVIEAMN